MLGQKANYLFKRLPQSDLLDNLSFISKVIKTFLFLLITNHLFIGCGVQNHNIPGTYNIMNDSISSPYEQEILRDLSQLYNTNRIISASPDIKDMTWLLVWDTNGEISIETNTSSEDKVYKLADAITRNGNFILASQSDLSNPEGLPEEETFRVLEFEHSSTEIKGRVLRANKQTILQIRDAIISQTAFTENTAPTEAFFRLTFARATHSYSINSNNLDNTAINQLLQDKQAYVFISNLYWTNINTNTSLNGVDITFNHNNKNNYGNNFGSPTSFYRPNTPNFRLDGNVDVSIDLVSSTEDTEDMEDNDHQIINIFFRQPAREFLDSRQIEDVKVVLTTDSDNEEFSNLSSIYLRQKTLSPFHFVFDISAFYFNASTHLTSTISNLMFIDPFENTGPQRDLISNIGVRKGRGTLGTIVAPFKWIGKGVGRIFGR